MAHNPSNTVDLLLAWERLKVQLAIELALEQEMKPLVAGTEPAFPYTEMMVIGLSGTADVAAFAAVASSLVVEELKKFAVEASMQAAAD